MEYGSATEGVGFTLPACGFSAPEGKQFKTQAIGSANGATVNTTDSTSDKTESPDSSKTGDTSPILLRALVMIASGLGITGYAVDKRHKKQNK